MCIGDFDVHIPDARERDPEPRANASAPGPRIAFHFASASGEVAMTADPFALPPLRLPQGVRSRYVPDVNGLTMHILEAGWEGERPLVLLLHGFPELAFSWRKVIVPLAEAGFHVVASDQRGYGRTTG